MAHSPYVKGYHTETPYEYPEILDGRITDEPLKMKSRRVCNIHGREFFVIGEWCARCEPDRTTPFAGIDNPMPVVTPPYGTVVKGPGK